MVETVEIAPRKLLRLSEVAERLGIPTNTLRAAVRRGELRPIRYGTTGIYRFEEHEVEAFERRARGEAA